MDTSETGYRTQAGKNLNISHGCFLQVAGFLFETPYQYQFSGSQCNFLWMRRSSASRHWQEHARFKQHALGMLPPDSSSSESQTLQHLMRLATATRAATNTSSPSHCMAWTKRQQEHSEDGKDENKFRHVPHKSVLNFQCLTQFQTEWCSHAGLPNFIMHQMLLKGTVQLLKISPH